LDSNILVTTGKNTKTQELPAQFGPSSTFILNTGEKVSSQLHLSNTIALPTYSEAQKMLNASRADDGDEDSSTAASSSDDEQGEDDEDEGSATGSLLRSALTGKATFRSSSPSGMANRANNFNGSIFGKGESPFKSIKCSNPSLSLVTLMLVWMQGMIFDAGWTMVFDARL
jgi:hypothetical protein